MEILPWIAFAYSLSMLTGLFSFKGEKQLKVALLSIVLLISLIPLVVSLFEFFTSPRSKTKRIKVALIKYFYGDWAESYLSERSLLGRPLYCNDITNLSTPCQHSRPFVLCSSSEPGIDFSSFAQRRDNILVEFTEGISDESKNYMSSIGLADVNHPQAGVTRWGYCNSEQVLQVFTCVPESKTFVYSVELLDTRVSFYYNCDQAANRSVRSSKKCDGEKVVTTENVNVLSFVYAINALFFIKDRSRMCCFVVNEQKTKNFGKWGIRMHSIGVDNL